MIRKQKNIIEEQKILAERQKDLVYAKQKETLGSIQYAKRIQQSLMPTIKYISRHLNDRVWPILFYDTGPIKRLRQIFIFEARAIFFCGGPEQPFYVGMFNKILFSSTWPIDIGNISAKAIMFLRTGDK
jgi:hypothetical protein